VLQQAVGAHLFILSTFTNKTKGYFAIIGSAAIFYLSKKGRKYGDL